MTRNVTNFFFQNITSACTDIRPGLFLVGTGLVAGLEFL